MPDVLCVFAHPDDEIFCANLLARFTGRGHSPHVACLTWGAPPRAGGEARALRPRADAPCGYLVGPGRGGEKTIEPIAAEYRATDALTEHTDRILYFQSLRLLRDADHLVIPGSDDPDYTASKLYPYILSRRPVLAVFHQRSSVVDVLQKTRVGKAVTFDGGMDVGDSANHVLVTWAPVLEMLPYTPSTDWGAFEPYATEAMTRRQVKRFDQIVPPS